MGQRADHAEILLFSIHSHLYFCSLGFSGELQTPFSKLFTFRNPGNQTDRLVWGCFFFLLSRKHESRKHEFGSLLLPLQSSQKKQYNTHLGSSSSCCRWLLQFDLQGLLLFFPVKALFWNEVGCIQVYSFSPLCPCLKEIKTGKGSIVLFWQIIRHHDSGKDPIFFFTTHTSKTKWDNWMPAPYRDLLAAREEPGAFNFGKEWRGGEKLPCKSIGRFSDQMLLAILQSQGSFCTAEDEGSFPLLFLDEVIG